MMNKILYRLAQIAQSLDDEGLHDEASNLDGALNDAASVVNPVPAPTPPQTSNIPNNTEQQDALLLATELRDKVIQNLIENGEEVDKDNIAKGMMRAMGV